MIMNQFEYGENILNVGICHGKQDVHKVHTKYDKSEDQNNIK